MTREVKRLGVATVAMAALLGAASLAVASQPEAMVVSRNKVAFEVSNVNELGTRHEIAAIEMLPVGCTPKTAVLLQHGLSYTKESWDIPGLSFAQALTESGYAVYTIDRLGYGESPLDNGHNVSTVAYYDMAAQIVAQLREDGYDHVAIGGHSAGAEASIGAAGTYRGVDALLVLGYHHFPSPELVSEFVTGDVVRGIEDGYEYFLNDAQTRHEWFYSPDPSHYDESVAAADAAAAVLTPSGEIHSIGPQPSRALQMLVDVPVLLQLADADRLFPIEYADEAATAYLLAPEVTIDEVPNAGHTFMLHHSGPASAERAAAWLSAHAATPACISE